MIIKFLNIVPIYSSKREKITIANKTKKPKTKQTKATPSPPPATVIILGKYLGMALKAYARCSSQQKTLRLVKQQTCSLVKMYRQNKSYHVMSCLQTIHTHGLNMVIFF